MCYNPRTEHNNLGFMICFHKKYILGDNHYVNHDDYTSWNHMGQRLTKQFNAAVILPLYLYDRSGLTIATTPFYDRWDSGQVGFIIASKNAVAHWFGAKYCTKKLIKLAKEVLINEVTTYDNYLTGNDEAEDDKHDQE